MTQNSTKKIKISTFQLIITANSLEQEKAIRSDLSEENKLLKNMISEKGKEIDEISKSLDDHK